MSTGLRTMAEMPSPAETLVELSKSISAPAFIPASEYAAVIGNTLLEMKKLESAPSASESLTEKVAQQAHEKNMSILEAAFSGKGVVMRGEG